ncbi:uncharacterized protein ACMZJ9_004652 [Mantella aurantiaca]
MAESIQHPELKSYITTQKKEYSFVFGKFLSINDSFDILSAKKSLSPTEQRMLTTLRKVKSHHFQHMQVSIPVYNIRHFTDNTADCGICRDEGFKITKYDQTPEFRDLSYWSPDISSEDLERARQQAYEKVSKVTDSSVPEHLKCTLREQFGNSSAFKEFVSSYGSNHKVKFSFPLSYLLDLYKDQHCGGREPKLRILGTALFRMEISHYIVVHSPDTEKFNDFPEVPTVQEIAENLPLVYWMDGTLYWRPESTSNALKATISENGLVHRKCYMPCPYFIQDGTCFHVEKGTYSAWNHLTVTFHLPNGLLKIPKENLMKNRAACNPDPEYLGKEKFNKEMAELRGEDERNESPIMASVELKKELECSICLIIYKDPVSLQCGHNYCQVYTDGVPDTQEESGGYSCPECRAKYQSRPTLNRNIPLWNMVNVGACDFPGMQGGHHN